MATATYATVAAMDDGMLDGFLLVVVKGGKAGVANIVKTEKSMILSMSVLCMSLSGSQLGSSCGCHRSASWGRPT